MFLSLQDTGISKELLAFGIHEPMSTKILNEQLKKGMRIVDIGANIGYYVLQEARIVGETGEITATEPVPYNFTMLKRNVEANGYQNIRLFRLAIGIENGTTKIYLSRESNLCSMTQQLTIHDTSIDVPVMTLDSFLEGKEKIDFIRMDIEGYEVKAIDGMLDILKKYKPKMMIEIHPFIVGGEAIIDYLKKLKSIGYETTFVIGRVYDNRFAMGKNRIEKMSLEKLIADKRIMQAVDAFMVFLEASNQDSFRRVD